MTKKTSPNKKTSGDVKKSPAKRTTEVKKPSALKKGIARAVKAVREYYKRIPIHHRPHLDELAAAYLLKHSGVGEKIYPGITKAEIVGVDPNTYQSKPDDKPIGFGRGELDDHVWRGKPMSGTELVAMKLGLLKFPAYRRFVRYVLRCDRHYGVRRFELPNLIKIMNTEEAPFEEVRDVVFKILERIVLSEFRFQDAYYHHPIDWTDFQTIDGVPLKIATTTYSPYAQKVARAKGAAVVVIRRDDGNVQIFGSTRHKTVLPEIVRLIRIAEMQARGIDYSGLTDDYLRSQGTIPECPWWHLVGEQILLNGSETQSKEATRLWQEIYTAIATGLRFKDRMQPHERIRRIMEQEALLDDIMEEDEEVA